jgi:hypothetical protein
VRSGPGVAIRSTRVTIRRAIGPHGARRLRGWMLGARHLRPDFVIIGAARSGTTHLLGQLNAHPNVLPGPAEVHYFDTHRHTYGMGWYRTRFPTTAQRAAAERRGLHPVVTGESSPSYLAHPNAPGRLARALPDVRLLVLLRDPAARAASHWAWCLRQCGETRSFRDAVEAELGPRGDERGLRIPAERRIGDPLVVRRGVYQPQLERWLTHFPREQLHVIVSERWFRETDAMMAGVLEFLGLPTGIALPKTMRNRNKEHPPYDEDVLERLRAFYRPHNARLADFLGMDLGWA